MYRLNRFAGIGIVIFIFTIAEPSYVLETIRSYHIVIIVIITVRNKACEVCCPACCTMLIAGRWCHAQQAYNGNSPLQRFFVIKKTELMLFSNILLRTTSESMDIAQRTLSVVVKTTYTRGCTELKQTAIGKGEDRVHIRPYQSITQLQSVTLAGSFGSHVWHECIIIVVICCTVGLSPLHSSESDYWFAMMIFSDINLNKTNCTSDRLLQHFMTSRQENMVRITQWENCDVISPSPPFYLVNK